MREKHMLLIYILSSLLKKRLMHVYGLTLMSFFNKNHDGELQDIACNYPRIIFFRRGNYGTPFLTARHRIAWNWFHISKVHYLFIFTTQTSKSVLNWVVLILIKQKVILKTRNQDFPPSKIEYVITILKWFVRLIW